MQVWAARFFCFVVVTMGCACSTVTLRPEAYELDSVALVSLHGRREITLQQSDFMPILLEGGLGDEVIEMSIGDTELSLDQIFGENAVLPAGKAMLSKKYDLVPEAMPPEEWTQVGKMLAVEVDDPRTPAALGALATDLKVDAAVVVRHEWWLQRDRVDIGTQLWAYDRCTLLVVDTNGVVLWRQTVVSRAPSRAMWASTFQVGFNGATWADEARTLARETARSAWNELRTRYAQGPTVEKTTTAQKKKEQTAAPDPSADPPADLAPPVEGEWTP